MGKSKFKFNSEEFKSGASYLVSDGAYRLFVRGRSLLGRGPDKHDKNGNLFCSPSEDINQAIKKSGGDLDKLEKILGFPPRYLGDGPIHRVDIKVPQNHNLRGATGYESSVNCFFATPPDEKGNLPEIIFVKDKDGRVLWKDDCQVIDAEKTDPNELKKLKGRYKTDKGVFHKPDLSEYDYRTSGGLYEGVLNNVPNTFENVSHYIIGGWARGKDANKEKLYTIVSKRPFAPETSKEVNKVNNITLNSDTTKRNNHSVYIIDNTTKTKVSTATQGATKFARTRKK